MVDRRLVDDPGMAAIVATHLARDIKRTLPGAAFTLEPYAAACISKKGDTQKWIWIA